MSLLVLAALLASGLFVVTSHWRADAATRQETTPGLSSAMGRTQFMLLPSRNLRASDRRTPGPAFEPYVKPEISRVIWGQRRAILAAAERHNRPELSGMSDHDFAVLIAVLLYTENSGWPEDQITPLRKLAPLYEELQIYANEVGGIDLTVQPAKLRPSVALEILRSQVPVPAPTLMITRPITVAGSRIQLDAYPSQSALYAAITAEIADPELAVEYLAANLERGAYRARYEGVPVTWRALGAWHSRGIVSPEDIRANTYARYYLRRASSYFGKARALIDWKPATIPKSKVAHP